jgi:hypothetical protein
MGKCKLYYLLIPFNIVLGLPANSRQDANISTEAVAKTSMSPEALAFESLARRSFSIGEPRSPKL